MPYILLSAVALVFLVTGFNRVYCIHGIDQVYLGLYKGMFDEAVVVVNGSGGYLSKPMFYLPRLESMLQEYYETSLPAYCRTYTFTVKGTTNGAQTILSRVYCDTVTTTFSAVINDFQTRTKKAVFTIERSPLYE